MYMIAKRTKYNSYLYDDIGWDKKLMQVKYVDCFLVAKITLAGK